ncbi:hypothetical protein LOK49_LG10G00052 [Camellia lanceoleosa]|uniref:Uncharacterized protein n=1 Tax=Camellia lanceoleosa TaxID=1840588 RepID=A0ACC0G5Y6_9ERIC|nr:hypothetical protein LOK49_LG10G00052 [Camellia lanceoleosa]
MALRMATLKSAGEKMGCAFGLRRWTHSIAQPPPLDTPMSHTTVSSPLVLPEHDHDSINNNNNNNNNVGFEFPSFYFGGGSMELMAVPKRKGFVVGCDGDRRCLWRIQSNRNVEMRWGEGLWGEVLRHRVDWYRLEHDFSLKSADTSPSTNCL